MTMTRIMVRSFTGVSWKDFKAWQELRESAWAAGCSWDLKTRASPPSRWKDTNPNPAKIWERGVFSALTIIWKPCEYRSSRAAASNPPTLGIPIKSSSSMKPWPNDFGLEQLLWAEGSRRATISLWWWGLPKTVNTRD